MHDMNKIAVDATFTKMTNKKRPLHQLLALHPTLLLPAGIGSRGQGGRGGSARGKGGGGVGAGQTEWQRHIQVAVGEDQGVQLSGNGGALASSLFHENPTDTNTTTGKCQDSEENSGRTSQGHRYAEGPVTI